MEFDEVRAKLDSKNREIESLKNQKIILKAANNTLEKSNKESLALKDMEIESLKNQLQNYQKMRQIIATKVFCSDVRNENLDNLLNCDIDELFEKYVQIINTKKSQMDNHEETIETINDIKGKLRIQTGEKEWYKKRYCQIVKALNIPPDDQSLANILQAVKELKKSNTHEQNEIDMYTKAQNILEKCENKTKDDRIF